MRAAVPIGVIVALMTAACADEVPQAADEAPEAAETPDHGNDDAAPPGAWTTHEDQANDVAVAVPPRWHVADEIQTPNLADPGEILTLATVELDGRSASHCAQQPGAVEQLGPSDALVTVQETTGTQGFPTRPRPIREFQYATDDLATTGCFANADDIVHKRIDFHDADRAFYVYATYGANPSDDLRHTVLRIVNSLRFS